MSILQKATLRWHILLIVLLSGIPGIAIVTYSTSIEEKHLRAMAADESAAAARHMVLEQRRLIVQTEQLLKRLAAMPEFVAGDARGCHRQIGLLLDFALVYASFGLATSDGHVVCSIVPPERRASMADRAYIQEVVKRRETYFGEYQVGRATGQASVPISSPIFAGGQLAGVAYAIVPVTWYAEMAEELRLPDGFTMTVLDRKWNVLARIPGDDWIGKNIAGHAMATAIKGTQAEGIAEIIGLDDSAHFAALAPLPAAGGEETGFVVVSAPQSAVFAEARAAWIRNLLALVMVIGMVILGASFGTERLVLRSVRNLVDASRSLRSGDMTARVAERGGSREVQLLGQTFNEMAAALHERELALRQAQRLAQLGSWEVNFDTDTAVWSEELYRIHGLDPRQRPLRYEELVERYMPDSRERLNAAVNEARRSGIAYRLDLQTSNDRWVTVRGEAVRDSAGRIFKLRGTSQDITERKRAEATVLAKNRELSETVQQLQQARDQTLRAEQAALSYAQRLRAMSSRIVEVQESEQRRLARELHDTVSSSLAVVGLELHTIQSELGEQCLAKVGSRLSDCIGLVKDTMENSRDISADLHCAMLDHAGLGAALEDLGQQFARRTRLAVDVTAPGEKRRAAPEKEVALFRIAQEALTNCVKHAQASSAAVELAFDEEHITLSISDDGRGFDPAGVGSEGLRQGLGLLSMRERAKAVGGEFLLSSAPGKGTRIVVRAPLRESVEGESDYVI